MKVKQKKVSRSITISKELDDFLAMQINASKFIEKILIEFINKKEEKTNGRK